MSDSHEVRLPHRQIRVGSRWTAEDIALVRSLLKQRSNLAIRRRRKALRASVVRLAHDMVLEMAGGGERGDHTTIVYKLADAFKVSVRTIDDDLKRHPSGDVEALKRAGWQAQKVR